MYVYIYIDIMSNFDLRKTVHSSVGNHETGL